MEQASPSWSGANSIPGYVVPPVLWASARRAGMSFVEDFLAGFVATSRRDTPHAQTSLVLCCMGSSPDQSLWEG